MTPSSDMVVPTMTFAILLLLLLKRQTFCNESFLKFLQRIGADTMQCLDLRFAVICKLFQILYPHSGKGTLCRGGKFGEIICHRAGLFFTFSLLRDHR